MRHNIYSPHIDRHIVRELFTAYEKITIDLNKDRNAGEVLSNIQGQGFAIYKTDYPVQIEVTTSGSGNAAQCITTPGFVFNAPFKGLSIKHPKLQSTFNINDGSVITTAAKLVILVFKDREFIFDSQPGASALAPASLLAITAGGAVNYPIPQNTRYIKKLNLSITAIFAAAPAQVFSEAQIIMVSRRLTEQVLLTTLPTQNEYYESTNLLNYPNSELCALSIPGTIIKTAAPTQVRLIFDAQDIAVPSAATEFLVQLRTASDLNVAPISYFSNGCTINYS
jgi:hypothetical protein